MSQPIAAQPHAHAPGVAYLTAAEVTAAAPANAIWVAITDLYGHVIGGGWVIAEHNDRMLTKACWSYFDARTTPNLAAASEPPLPVLSLLP